MAQIEKPNSQDYVYLLLDQLFCYVLPGTAIIQFWRGSWGLLDQLLIPNSRTGSAWICFVLGNLGMITLSLTQKFIKRHLGSEQLCSIKWLIGCHVYSYIGGVLCVMLWRGIWILLDQYSGISVLNAATTAALAWMIMLILKASNNCRTSPMVMCIDTNPEMVFEFTTRFNTKMEDNIILHILDNLLTTAIIHNLVVFFWRGLWELEDLLVYPDDTMASSCTVLLVSCTILLAATILQLIMLRYRKHFATKQVNIGHVICGALIQGVINVGTVCQWRAVWYISDIYLVASNPLISFTISHVCGFLATALLLCSSSLMSRCCILDGTMFSESSDVMVPNRYFRYFIMYKKVHECSNTENIAEIEI